MDNLDCVSFDSSDFEVCHELLCVPKINSLPPLILIPGVCGSKLDSISKATGEHECVWIQPSLKALTSVCQFLWGKYNVQTKHFDSFASGSHNIEPIPGILGCDHLIESSIWDNRLFENLTFTNYYSQLTQYLSTKYGYEYGYNMFAFTYDWRQSLSDDCIQSRLDDLIKRVCMINDQKVILIGHSLGGQVIEMYFRLHKYSDKYVQRVVTLSGTMDGASAFCAQTPLLGYNLQLPIPKCVAKVCQVGSGVLPYLSSSPRSKGIISQIFVKKIGKQIDEYSRDEKEDRNTFRYESDEYSQVVLNGDVYQQGETPDVLYLIAKDAYDNRLIKPELVVETFKQFQKGCKRGAIQILSESQPLFQKKPYEVVEKNFDGTPTTEDFHWECFSQFGEQIGSLPPIKFQYKENKFVKISGNELKFTKQFYHLFEQPDQSFKYSQNRDLGDYFLAKQYYLMQNQEENKHAKCTSPAFELRGPWEHYQEHSDAKESSLLRLALLAHQPGTIDRAIYRVTPEPLENAIEDRSKPIVLMPNTTLKYYCICGSGVKTPVHAVY